MLIDITTISNEQVKLFYTLYLPQYHILRDFFERLSEEQFDYRMVDTRERRSDSPRESLAHLLEQRLIVLNGVKTLKLEFISMQVEHYYHATKEELLAAWDRIEQEMFAYLSGDQFAAAAKVSNPWNVEMTGIETLYLIRDHDILHVGWNLALMDHLNMERFPSLSEYWG